MWDNDEVLKKYWEIIKEEINIKDISAFGEDLKITKIFKPLGSALSAKFWKDTGKIIQNGKSWNIKELDDGKVEIFDNNGNTRTLEKNEYEIAYQWLEGDDIAIEWDIIAKLDLDITPDLQREWVSREISRFLNQMRKEADYKVDDKVVLLYNTTHTGLEEILNEFKDFLKSEALISEIKKEQNPEWDTTATFTHEDKEMQFALLK